MHSEHERATTEAGRRAVTQSLLRKIGRQVAKDYVLLPALSLRRWRRTLAANVTANLLRNLWAYVVIFCGHFPPDGVQQFAPEILQQETRGGVVPAPTPRRGQLQRRPCDGFLQRSPVLPDRAPPVSRPACNRYAEISVRVRELCDKYDLAYTTGSLARQYLQTLRTNFRLALPDEGLRGRWGLKQVN